MYFHQFVYDGDREQTCDGSAIHEIHQEIADLVRRKIYSIARFNSSCF